MFNLLSIIYKQAVIIANLHDIALSIKPACYWYLKFKQFVWHADANR